MSNIRKGRLEFTLGDDTLLLSPLTDQDMADVDFWLQDQVIQVARRSLSPQMSQEERDEMLQAAMKVASGMTLFSRAGAKIMGTIDGISRLIWQSARHNHPQIKYEEIKKLMASPAKIEEAMEKFDRVNGYSKGKEDPGDTPPEDPEPETSATVRSPKPTGTRRIKSQT